MSLRGEDKGNGGGGGGNDLELGGGGEVWTPKTRENMQVCWGEACERGSEKPWILLTPVALDVCQLCNERVKHVKGSGQFQG